MDFQWQRMAKFSVAYVLCPLIDSRSLLGVNVDKDVDCVIVTIGKNIVIRYKFQDQKQVSSWSTTDKLSSPVVYDPFLSMYLGVFNQDQLRMWKEEDQLDKVKKYKFQEPLHSVIPDTDGNCSFVLFRCGQVATVTQALEARKQAISNPILSNNETIKEYTIVTCNCVKYVAFTSCTDKNELYLNLVSVADSIRNSRYVLTSVNSGSTIVGYRIISKNNTCCLLTLWSDGSLYSFTFLPDISEEFPGVFIEKITFLSTKHPVAITSISNNHLSFFGADCGEEGAMLVLFNLQFHLIQAKLHFKLYTKPPKVWNVSNHLLVNVGNNLIAVPYLLEVEQLSTLVGIHSTSKLCMTETSWDNETTSDELMAADSKAPENIGKRIELLKLEGWPQAIILQRLIPDLLEKRDCKSILWCLKNFSDFPEHIVVRLLIFCFSVSDLPPVSGSHDVDKSKVLENGFLNSGDETSNPVEDVSGLNKPTALVDAVLNLSTSDVYMRPLMRGVPFVITLKLLNYLSYLLDNESSVSTYQVIDWICLVLDSHYQEYRLCQNDELVSLLKDLNQKVYSKLEYMNDLKKLAAILEGVRHGKRPLQRSKVGGKMYSVESLHLY